MINLNTAFEDELYYQYLKDPDSVSKEWREYFEKKSKNPLDYEYHVDVESPKINTIIKKTSNIYIDPEAEIIPLNNISSKIAENMEESLQVPTATSTRIIPVKALDENRRIINKYLHKMKRPKVSFTHLLAWALVKALIKFPQMNDAFILKDGKSSRIKRKSINIGLAIDIQKKDGNRLLLVPNVKNAQNLNFLEFIQAFETIIQKTRNNKLDIDDLQGTTVTLTNPGMIGTTASAPRLMNGQGLIFATGSIDYPTEFQAVRPEILTNLAISKVVTVTNTYDHRIIQGAESAEFLNYINKLLIGEYHFYDQIFTTLKIPFEPIRWNKDNTIYTRQGRIDEDEAIEKAAHVMMMINAYRVRGHLLASINPLGFASYYYPELDPAFYGFTIWDLDRYFHAEDHWQKKEVNLRDIIEILRDTYCGSIGYEFMHIQEPHKKDWIKQRLENKVYNHPLKNEEKKYILKQIIEAELFENFLHTKFVGHKRFSLEGSETIIVLINKIFEDAVKNDLNSIIIGMPHRGRLNVLAHSLGKSPEKIFREFTGELDDESYFGSGDVKYHLGAEGLFEYNGKTIKVMLSPNPSHLELVDPVVEGMARAIDDKISDKSHKKSLPVLIHGDSAFSGQGIISETLNLSQLEAYKTGGTIHIIINNQIGFTTTSEDARSSVYCTDIAKMLQVPILHVNGNDPEAIITAANFAVDYRNEFNTDIIIDVLSYRKYGHNEADEPSYTQPLLYKKIKSMQPVSKIYQQQLINEGSITQAEAEEYYKQEYDKLNEIFIKATKKKEKSIKNLVFETKVDLNVDTSVSEDIIKEIGNRITQIPSNFNIHPKLIKFLDTRKSMIESEKQSIDWSFAEALSFGTILIEKKDIRLTGQDSRRGTFSQRHSVLTDMVTEKIYIPLNNIRKGQGKFRIYDSPLSELAVLGFEYGYSVIAKDGLTIWEAQFGDFANGAQAVIDQFIACSEIKWGQQSNLVMLLPHSYDGQGPEHSSARLERFLQLCADDNLIVCNLSTPAQYFHALRRQTLIKRKKPLIIMTPKSMLRHPMAVSSVKDLAYGKFQDIIDDALEGKNANKIERIILCSGKIYWELKAYEDKNNLKNVAIIRVEQLYPFNSELLKEFLSKYKIAKQVLWVQEEPQNMGAWSFISQRLMNILPDDVKLFYVGRKESASTSTGYLNIHLQEQTGLIKQAFKKLE